MKGWSERNQSDHHCTDSELDSRLPYLSVSAKGQTEKCQPTSFYVFGVDAVRDRVPASRTPSGCSSLGYMGCPIFSVGLVATNVHALHGFQDFLSTNQFKINLKRTVAIIWDPILRM